ncbi:protein STAY-GREEN homolog, chloroplastic-like [Actinidia eriantha]|uniref:protein STAY-GREEN homolog, chloroplastic-like n=1 Tax=Actinidia eriantha TaxID=165200 RepID=UPI0025864A7E|nr:protein STAY-GREEN homolog, chloroplastic-like [Actinidia eriantha]
MATLNAFLVLPPKLQQSSIFIYTRRSPMKHQPFIPVARLFVPAILESSKLKVLLLGDDEKKHPWKLPRIVHGSELNRSISQNKNNSQHLKERAKKIELEASERRLFGEDFEGCSIDELQEVENQLEQSLSNIRARKVFPLTS